VLEFQCRKRLRKIGGFGRLFGQKALALTENRRQPGVGGWCGMAVVIVPGARVQLTDRYALFGKVSFPLACLYLVEPDPASTVVHFNAYFGTSRHLLFES